MPPPPDPVRRRSRQLVPDAIDVRGRAEHARGAALPGLVELVAAGQVPAARVQEEGRRFAEQRSRQFLNEVMDLGLTFVGRLQRSSTTFAEGLYDRILGPDEEAVPRRPPRRSASTSAGRRGRSPRRRSSSRMRTRRPPTSRAVPPSSRRATAARPSARAWRWCRPASGWPPASRATSSCAFRWTPGCSHREPTAPRCSESPARASTQRGSCSSSRGPSPSPRARRAPPSREPPPHDGPRRGRVRSAARSVRGRRASRLRLR